MGCLALLGLIALLFFGVRLAPGEPPPTPVVATVAAPVQMMTPTPTPLPGIMIMASFGAEGATPMDLLSAASIIQTRIDMLDLQGAQVVVSEDADNPRLNVYIPSGDDRMHTLNLLTAPGYLEFVDISDLSLNMLNDVEEAGSIWTTGQAQRFGSNPSEGAVLNPRTDAPFETVIDGTMVSGSLSELDQSGQWIVIVGFDQTGTEIMENFSAEHLGNRLAIVVDGKVLSTPTLMAQLNNGAVIQGNFTEQQARELAVQIGSGPLPVKLEPLDIS